jgi:hypothetical protein
MSFFSLPFYDDDDGEYDYLSFDYSTGGTL